MFQSHNGSIFLSFPRALCGTGALPKHHSPSVGGVAIRSFHQHDPPFPRSDLVKSTQSFISSKWGLSEGRIQNGGANLAFVTDPFPNAPAPGSGSNTSSLNNASAPVLRIQYLAGSFQDNNVGGAQFYAMWNASGGAFQSMLLSYEVAFDSGFDWVKGGKLPGLGLA